MFRKLMLVLFVMLALVIGAGVVAAAENPLDVQPPVTCGHGSAVIPLAGVGVGHNLNHVAPCSWLVKFAGTGRWKMEAGPNAPVVVVKAFHYPLCTVTAKGIVKGTAECAIVVKAAPEEAEGKSYRFSLTEQ